MNRFFTFCITIYFFVSICSASEVSHPPTFQQMKNASSKEGCGDSAIYEALKYTDNDIKLIKNQHDYRYIIGAAYQYDKQKTVSFLKEYLPLIENNAVGLSLFISSALQNFEQIQNIDFESYTERLIKIDPENSYTFYIKAYYLSKVNDADKCLFYLREGNRRKIFNNFLIELSNISIKTSLFLGYSKFAAQNYALGLQHDIGVFSELSKYLTQKTLKPDFKIECLKMGMVLRKNSKNILNDLLSLAVKLRALKEMENKENEIRAIEKERQESWELIETANAIEETYDIPEDRQVEYYNDVYSESETYAILKLLKEFPLEKH